MPPRVVRSNSPKPQRMPFPSQMLHHLAAAKETCIAEELKNTNYNHRTRNKSSQIHVQFVQIQVKFIQFQAKHHQTIPKPRKHGCKNSRLERTSKDFCRRMPSSAAMPMSPTYGVKWTPAAPLLIPLSASSFP